MSWLTDLVMSLTPSWAEVFRFGSWSNIIAGQVVTYGTLTSWFVLAWRVKVRASKVANKPHHKGGTADEEIAEDIPSTKSSLIKPTNRDIERYGTPTGQLPAGLGRTNWQTIEVERRQTSHAEARRYAMLSRTWILLQIFVAVILLIKITSLGIGVSFLTSFF